MKVHETLSRWHFLEDRCQRQKIDPSSVAVTHNLDAGRHWLLRRLLGLSLLRPRQGRCVKEGLEVRGGVGPGQQYLAAWKRDN